MVAVSYTHLVALGKIKNDSGFIECIFAAKTARELPQEEVTVSDSKPSDSGAVTPDVYKRQVVIIMAPLAATAP